MGNENPQPSREQLAASERVQKAICAEMNLCAREGASVAAILAGTGAAIADLITTQRGSAYVADWFARQAVLVKQLQSGD